ncbi:transposase family protein, partial [Klebsiella pneumoniae]
MRQLKRLLRPLKDPRASNVRHDLVEIIVIALAATLAGAKTCTEFEFFGKGREELLQRFLELRSGIPSHDTFSNVFRALDPKGLEAILRKLSKGFGIKGVVSIDGNLVAIGGLPLSQRHACACRPDIDHMQRCGLPPTHEGAAQRLAVDADHALDAEALAELAQNRFQPLRVQSTEDVAERIVAGDAGSELQEPLQQLLSAFAEELELGAGLGAG